VGQFEDSSARCAFGGNDLKVHRASVANPIPGPSPFEGEGGSYC
jgi:hypothetical protein